MTVHRDRSPDRVHRRGSALVVGMLGWGALAVLAPAVALAHPLGNFTINHFAAIRVSPDGVALDVVIDRAEIPAFQEQRRLDVDGDGTLAPREIAREGQAACLALAGDLRLAVNGTALEPSLVAAGLATPTGAGGLPTMRLVCEYEAAIASPIAGQARLSFEDRSFAERIGWREIVVLGDRVTIDDPRAAPPAGGISQRLATYPEDLLAQPLDMRSVSVVIVPGGPSLPPWTAPDAEPLTTGGADGGTSGSTDVPGVAAGSVPGGIAEDLAALVDVRDLTPLAILVSLAIALVLGVIHALSPGHGKTIMAAYLVGGRGSSRQAVGLGLAVAASHTLGVLVLAGITLAATSVLPPERLYPILGVISGGLVIAIGASLLWSRLRPIARQRAHRRAHAHGAHHDHAEPHGHGHAHAHDHPHEHGHGPTGDTISWRGLIALGLSGGLVPSASALILLLGSIAAGRVAYGLVLVLGFGLGMAAVLGGIGLALVHARRFVERRPSVAGLGRVVIPIQLATASIVVVLGVVLTGQALAQVV